MTSKDRVRRVARLAGGRPVSAAARQDLDDAVEEVTDLLERGTPEQRAALTRDLEDLLDAWDQRPAR